MMMDREHFFLIFLLLTFLETNSLCDTRFSQFPGCLEPGDPRSTYSAFAIASMFNDWSGIHIDLALEFLSKCQVRIILFLSF